MNRNETNGMVSQQGFSMLEVLIAIVVLAIGLLGLMGLQSSAAKLNQSALSRSIATDYANTMMDKMRANVEEARLGKYDISSAGTLKSPTANSKAELEQWLSNLKQAIPNARAQVCRTDKADGKCTGEKGEYFRVCVRWDQGDRKLFEEKTEQVMLMGRL